VDHQQRNAGSLVGVMNIYVMPFEKLRRRLSEFGNDLFFWNNQRWSEKQIADKYSQQRHENKKRLL
jgi:hypothetical protein